MYVAHLSLTDFRGYAALELPLESGPSVFIGANGEGKTNLLEAVGYAGSLSSHRVAADLPLVRAGADRAVVRVAASRSARSTLVEIEINPGRANRARLNRVPVSRPREVLGVLSAVMFAPEDLALVKGDPADRRRFLDDLLVTRAPRLAGVRADYDRVLKQRNALLKSASAARRSGSELATLDVWDTHLTRYGVELLAARLDLVDAIRPLVASAYAAVADDDGRTGMEYRSSLGADLPPAPDPDGLAAAMRAALAQSRRAELERGVSLVGPHRDELVLFVGGLPARGYASHGESWALALALRLASYQLLGADGADPVLLLDDVFAELDSGRRERLAELVQPAEQVLVTAAVAEDVPKQLQERRYRVGGGTVTLVE